MEHDDNLLVVDEYECVELAEKGLNDAEIAQVLRIEERFVGLALMEAGYTRGRGLTPEELLHVKLVRCAGCEHPPYYDFGDEIILGFCALCRQEHVKHRLSLDPNPERLVSL